MINSFLISDITISGSFPPVNPHENEKAPFFRPRGRNNPLYFSGFVLYSGVHRCYDVFTVREVAGEKED